MLEVQSLGKTFPAPKRKKGAPEVEKDPREEGKLFHAVKDVSFSCNQGEILGLLGVNGAGKTTTLRMLATAIKPTSGTAVLDGHDIVGDPLEVRRRIGFLSGSTGVYGRLTPREMVRYYGRLNNMKDDVIDQRSEQLFDLLDMKTYVDKRCDNLSTGMKQKASIARTLIHDPAVLFFDEPTSGLDVISSRTIVDFIRRCKDDGKTVVLSTHHMSEVERLCDRVVVIHQGITFFNGTLDELAARTGQQNMDEAFLALVGGDRE